MGGNFVSIEHLSDSNVDDLLRCVNDLYLVLEIIGIILKALSVLYI